MIEYLSWPINRIETVKKSYQVLLGIIIVFVAVVVWETRTALRPKETKGHIDRKTGKLTIDTIRYLDK
jgi:hypothetical protein